MTGTKLFAIWSPRPFRTSNLLVIPIRLKKYYVRWKVPFHLEDFQNVTRSSPNAYDQWNNEWKNSNLSRELQLFDIFRLPTHLKARFKPNKDFFSIKSKREQMADYQRRIFGIYGLKSGVELSTLFPTVEAIQLDTEMDKLKEKSVLEVMRNKRTEQEKFVEENENLIQRIKSNLEKMPELIEKFQNEKVKQSKTSDREKEKYHAVMEEARDRYGYYLEPHDDKFKKLKEEFEEKEKLERKQKKSNK